MAVAMFPPLNRTSQSAFLQALQREMNDCEVAGTMLGLIVVQLGSVSELNFRAGYSAVDAALEAFGARLQATFGNRAAVIRTGTRRFAVVLRELRTDSHALLAANKVTRVAEEVLQERWLQPLRDLRQGISLYPAHATESEGLLQCAEVALNDGACSQSATSLFHAEVAEKISAFGRIEEDFEQALQQGGIEPFFQPQVDLASGDVIGAEALVRCRGRNGDFIPPQALIEVAERTKRIAVVTSAMLTSALRYAAEWPKSNCSLSINVSPQSLKERDFLPLIVNALKIWNWPPQALTVEVTESAFMDEPEKCFATMRDLRDLGVEVAIDDFGTGYSSFSYFTNIPANELKVDKSFVFDMLGSDANRRVVQAIINLAHGFDLKVVAEGVEDQESMEALQKMSCDVVQGYHIGRPMAPAEFASWLSQR